jgi:hypothetical protein
MFDPAAAYAAYNGSDQDATFSADTTARRMAPAQDSTPVANPPTASNLTRRTNDVPEQELTVLIFRDGHRLEIRNYAIVGLDIFNFSGPGPRRIALADLNLEATRRANDERGVDFLLPTGQ